MISVIIPVYNSSKFLGECVESVLSQTYRNFEIILVDDGSTDGSDMLCDWYAQQYSNITAIHKPNEGVTSARRVGLERSRGEFITFLDSDDIIHDNCLYELKRHMTEDIDLVVSEVKYEEKLQVTRYIYNILNGNIPAGISGKLYRKELFDDLSLSLPNDIVIGEDLIMNIKIALNCSSSIQSITSNLYYYRPNPASVTHTRKYTWNYEERFIEELNTAFKNKRDEHIDAIMSSYFITIEKMTINKIQINWENQYLFEFLKWATKQRLSLKHLILLRVHNVYLAKALLAIHRRLSSLLS